MFSIRKWAVLILASFLLMPFPGAPTPPVDLDPGFGSSGVVTTSFGGVNAEFISAQILPGGKILAAGGSFDLPNWDFALARYLPDGSLDPAFGQGGKVVTKFGNMASINAMAIQPDGKIVAAGTVWIGTSHTAFALARYDPCGSLDSTFGDQGKVIIDVGNWVGLNALALQADGKIVIGGNIHLSAVEQQFTLRRYLPDGRLDTDFGKQGQVSTEFPVANHPGAVSLADSVAAIFIQKDGKLLAAGSGGGGNFALARYNPDGSLDLAFGNQGLVTTVFDGISGIQKLLVLPDGKFLAAGFAYNAGGRSDIALARYNKDGSLDHSFGEQGTVTANFGFQDSIIDANLLPDGQVLITGLAASEQKYVNGFQFLALYQANGFLDDRCGIDGVKNLANYPLRIWSSVIQPDGNLLLAGSGNQVAELMRLRALPGDCLAPG